MDLYTKKDVESDDPLATLHTPPKRGWDDTAIPFTPLYSTTLFYLPTRIPSGVIFRPLTSNIARPVASLSPKNGVSNITHMPPVDFTNMNRKLP